ncbi:MerR family transcriptional regulator [Actinomyces oricola]|uniref:MerR family transcriptional regulator n=1 Tax=Actinomyces oricola TaxID=206043 RepID=UPI000FFEAB56|nr:MerR family transcriptional regulator [Actinomyces oricola]
MASRTARGRATASISALSQRSGIPIATIKYYVREGLIQPGQDRGVDDEETVDQLRLIRGLVHVVGLSIRQVREILKLIGDQAASPATLMVDATTALPLAGAQGADHAADDVDLADARASLAAVGFDELPDAPYVTQLLAAMALANECGVCVDPEHLAAYAHAARECATADFKHLPLDSPGRAAQAAVLGTAIYDPILIGLRRLAHRELVDRLPQSHPQDPQEEGTRNADGNP